MRKELKALWSCIAFIDRTWRLLPKMALWLYKCVIILKITCDGRMVGHQAETPTESRMYYDHRANENNVHGSANTGNGGGVCSTDGTILLTKTRSKKPRNRA